MGDSAPAVVQIWKLLNSSSGPFSQSVLSHRSLNADWWWRLCKDCWNNMDTEEAERAF